MITNSSNGRLTKMADEIQQCLEYLNKSISKWIQELDAISRTTLAGQKTDQSKLQSWIGLQASKTTSNEVQVSARPNGASQISYKPPTRSTKPNDQTSSLWSGYGGSSQGLRRRASRNMYYNADPQKRLATMVQDMSTGRNDLYKAKIHNRNLAVSIGSARTVLENRPLIRNFAKVGIQDASYNGTNMYSAAETLALALDELDTALVQCQTLCEEAAHQLLREGECRETLASIQSALQGMANVVDAQSHWFAGSDQQTKGNTEHYFPGLHENLPSNSERAKTEDATSLEIDEQEDDDASPLGIRAEFSRIALLRSSRHQHNGPFEQA